MHLGPYKKQIIAELDCTADDAAMVEDIMRNEVFHSTLDWQSAAKLRRGAREAWAILDADREFFESHYRDARRIFEEMKQQGVTA